MSRQSIAVTRSNKSKCNRSTDQTKRARPTASKGLTFWLFFPALAIVASTTAAYWLGWTSFVVAVVILVPSYYFLAMCVHDAIHRAAHNNRHLNRAVGWIAAATMALPYNTIRRTHLRHHASLGHEHDHEGFIYRSALTLPVRLLVVNWRCYGILPQSPRREKLQAAGLLVGVVVLLSCFTQPLFWGWLVPMQLGVALFALMTVYLPHGPFATWVMKHIPAVTGYHDDHHAMPQLPWYQHFSLRRSSRKHRG